MNLVEMSQKLGSRIEKCEVMDDKYHKMVFLKSEIDATLKHIKDLYEKRHEVSSHITITHI